MVGLADLIPFLTHGPAQASPLAAIPANWLVKLLEINLPGSSLSAAALSELNFVDLSLILIFTLFAACLYPLLAQVSKPWSLAAVALPVLGIPVLIATGTAGRSSVLMSALILSALMSRSSHFDRRIAYAGIAAAVLLFFMGDIATAAVNSALWVAYALAAGYILWEAWLLLVSLRLSQLRGALRH